MFDSCVGCGSKEDFVFYRIDIKNNTTVLCRNCHKGNRPGVRDVWYGYGSGEHTEENICDPATGKPIPFSSREGKYQAMKKAGVVEAGDTIHGARTTFTK